MSYLCGNVEVGAFGPPPPLTVSQMKSAADTAAADATPTGLLWMAPRSVQEAAARRVSPTTAGIIQGGAQLVAQAQGYLMQLGLFPGPVTGVMDQNTQQALEQFRGYAQLPQGGPVTQSDVVAMQQVIQMSSQGVATAAPQPAAAAPSFFDSLPSWALPVGAVGGAFLLLKLLKK